MTEKLLQFIWQHQYFNVSDLFTTAGERVHIIDPGKINHHQGPDFLNAKISMDDALWIGNVELHVYASQWITHAHSEDPLYKNVILHVVWKEDAQLDLPFPVLELQSRISHHLLEKYEQLMQSPRFIACQGQIQLVPEIHINAWKQRLLIEKLDSKKEIIQNLLKENNVHWEETFWWVMASGFGIKLNSESFMKIASSISYNILVKHTPNLLQIESLLLGQAGILDANFTEKYPRMLRKEYEFLKKKYALAKIHFPLYYLRMRPANFPTIRLAQLAVLFHKNDHLFSKILEAHDVSEITECLQVQANDYWHYHYLPDQPAKFQIKKLGKDTAAIIVMNAVLPMMYTYGTYHKNESLCDKALRWMEMLPPENNTLIRSFKKLQIEVKNAFDSQALIYLKNEYCNYKRCLECAIGCKLMSAE